MHVSGLEAWIVKLSLRRLTRANSAAARLRPLRTTAYVAYANVLPDTIKLLGPALQLSWRLKRPNLQLVSDLT